ncbi:DUF4270 domain-containing protein [uncultured Winogradskyella sp.]|uniref:DUF4270 domain-containing protein n=1 Tax=uncultured Winogradskyella sp. TaxID=395353 RepID=UPI00261D4F44|nr:DUF4270 domain-containing protein [uncultured Winogradskyella sp.]|tara:strand:+ start:6674 stop:8368 length:1695 start_codon:yes stop_codon:yes gene_type:complete
MKKNKFALQILGFGLVITSFIACSNDFSTIESDVVNSNNATSFRIESNPEDIITYTKPVGPVQSNEFGLNLSTLGIYDDVYGRTTAGFVTQLAPSTINPVFGDNVTIDSVVVTIPFFSTASEFDEDGNIIYDVDSILPKSDDYKSLKLRIFENKYFIRDFNPDGDFNESQDYYSNKTASTSEDITNLEGEELTFIDYDDETGLIATPISNIIDINNNGYQLKDVNNLDDDGNKTLLESQSPGIRIQLDPTFWQNKIIDKEGDAVLSSQNNFAEYFRGLYFKAEPNDDDDGSFLLLNTGNTNANITIYYKNTTEVDEVESTTTGTYALNFGPNKVNFFDNEFTLPIDEGNSETGDSKIYLKGGEGSVAAIKLFDGFYDEDAGITNFEHFRSQFVNLVDGEFESSRRLVNEANLVFYVDQNSMQDNEPNRLFLYDIDNNLPLVDYYLDGTNNSLPSFSIINHLGPLERVDEDDPTSTGVKYKFKITEHINNLLIRDSTNIELGLAVSLNVNIEETSTQRKVQTNTDIDFKVPASSTVSPRGVILHGNNTNDQSKKVYLEIYYTEPN